MENFKNQSYVKIRHNSLYINQRIELFLILTDGSYEDKSLFVPGTIRPGYYINNTVIGNFARVMSNSITNLFRGMFIKKHYTKKIGNKLHCGINPEVKPIGAFIVKSLKNP